MVISANKPVQRQHLDIVYPNYGVSNLVKFSGISIIIPTFKRVSLCHKLLQSLEVSKQQIDIPTEVIIVDNSPRKEAQQIADLCIDYEVKYYHQSISVAAKRNFGAKVAQHSLLLFIDSDCEATPDLIKEHFLYYQKHPQTKALLGSTEFSGKKSFVWKALNLTPFLVPFRLADQDSEQIWGPSNNFSITKNTFQQIEGFNEEFPLKPGGEDVDFGYRLYQQGHIFKTNPLAKVYHTTETWNSFTQNFHRFFNWGKGEFYLYVNHHNHLYYDVPKSSLIFLIFLIISTVLSFTSASLSAYLLPLIFLGTNYLARLILSVINQHQKITNLVNIAIAELFVIVYEWGLTWECFLQGCFVPLFNRLIVEKDQSLAMWNQQVIYTWVTFLQILVTVGLWKLWTNFGYLCFAN